ncbi:hypothetical protein BH18ACT7_BH18ACT7_16420 [soil metagenome]
MRKYINTVTVSIKDYLFAFKGFRYPVFFFY